MSFIQCQGCTKNGYHMAQINAINAKAFPAEAETWEAMKNQVYAIADTLVKGIVKQFFQKS